MTTVGKAVSEATPKLDSVVKIKSRNVRLRRPESKLSKRDAASRAHPFTEEAEVANEEIRMAKNSCHPGASVAGQTRIRHVCSTPEQCQRRQRRRRRGIISSIVYKQGQAVEGALLSG